MPKQNKIIVYIAPDEDSRTAGLSEILLKNGFALTKGTAKQLIRPTPHDFDLQECYFVAAATYNFRVSTITTQRLFELAARGLFVAVACKRLPPEYEAFCEMIV